MVKNRELSSIIPESINEPEIMNEEFTIDIEDDYVLTTGEHLGRIASFNVFTSKNGVRYGKVKIGTVKKYGNKCIVHEMERVFYADYHANSELVKLFSAIGCIEGGKMYPNRVMNIPVKFTVVENAENASAHKFLITEIVPVEKLPDEIDFRYVKTYTGLGYEHTPVFLDAKEVTKSEKNSKTSFKEIMKSINDDTDFE